MKKTAFLMFGLVLGVGIVFGLARFVYRPASQQKIVSLENFMPHYIEKQKQTLSSLNPDEFNAKASQQLEQFMSDAITLTDTAKVSPVHSELQQFATDSTYALAYNREGVRIIQEDLGIRPKHGDGKHCDSVGC